MTKRKRPERPRHDQALAFLPMAFENKIRLSANRKGVRTLFQAITTKNFIGDKDGIFKQDLIIRQKNEWIKDPGTEDLSLERERRH